MVDYTTPVTSTFEMQRQTIEQGQRALARSLEFQQDMSDAFVAGLDSQRSAQERSVELGRNMMHSSIDVMAQNTPGMDDQFADLREAVDEGYDALLDTHGEAFDAMTEQFESGSRTYDETAEDALAAMDEQIEMLIEVHEQLESQSVEALRQFADQFERVQDQADEMTEEMARQVREGGEEAIEA